jgi:hypothetical protein
MRAWKVVKILVMVILACVVFGYVTERLWNWLMPEIFGLKAISYWQAIGLLLLSKMLFGGFHKHGGRGGWKEKREWKRRMKQKFEHMSPEERERFREAVKDRWGGHACGPWGRRDWRERDEVREPEVKG